MDFLSEVDAQLDVLMNGKWVQHQPYLPNQACAIERNRLHYGVVTILDGLTAPIHWAIAETYPDYWVGDRSLEAIAQWNDKPSRKALRSD